MAKETVEQVQAELTRLSLKNDFLGLNDADLLLARQALEAAEKEKAASDPQRQFEKRVANATDRELQQLIWDADAPLREHQRKNNHV